MDINILRSIATVLSLIIFVGIFWWAFASRNRARFEEAAQLPFMDKDENALQRAQEHS